MNDQHRLQDDQPSRPSDAEADAEAGQPVRRAVALPPVTQQEPLQALRPAMRGEAPIAGGEAEDGPARPAAQQPRTTSGTPADTGADAAAATRVQPEPEPEPRADGRDAASASAATTARAAAGTDADADTDTAGGTATAASVRGVGATAAATTGAPGRGPDAGGGSPGRPKKPMLAAAGIAGAVLISVPLLVMAGDDSDEESKKDRTAAAADSGALYEQGREGPLRSYAPQSPEADDKAGDKVKKDERKGTKADGNSGSEPERQSSPSAGIPAADPPQGSSGVQKASPARKAVATEKKEEKEVTVYAYRLVSADSGKCLSAGARSVGERPVIRPCGTGNEQYWAFHQDNTIRNGSLCMALAGGSIAKGTSIRLEKCDGTDAQKFRLNATDDLVSLKAGNKCVDVAWGKEDDGTPAQLWPCTGTANQTWTRG